MNKEKSWKLYALHILDCIEKIRAIQKRGDVFSDVVLYDAVLRNLQTLSESTRRLPKHLRQEHAVVPWEQISGFRNVIAHDYLGDINPTTVRVVIEVDLNTLEPVIKSMLELVE